MYTCHKLFTRDSFSKYSLITIQCVVLCQAHQIPILHKDRNSWTHLRGLLDQHEQKKEKCNGKGAGFKCRVTDDHHCITCTVNCSHNKSYLPCSLSPPECGKCSSLHYLEYSLPTPLLANFYLSFKPQLKHGLFLGNLSECVRVKGTHCEYSLTSTQPLLLCRPLDQGSTR